MKLSSLLFIGVNVYSDLAAGKVIFGTLQPDKNSTLNEEVKVEKIFLHPDYNRMILANDIAVLKLARPVKWTNLIRPVCLPKTDNETEMYKTCYVAGWGLTSVDHFYFYYDDKGK